MATAHASPSSASELSRTPIPPPECVVIPARKEHTATVVLLHGLGDSAKMFSTMACDTLMNHADLEHVKFIFPSAPGMHVSGNKNIFMSAWFNYYSLDIDNERKVDEKGLFQSVQWVKDIIEKEETEHGIPSQRIVVGGLSQGEAVAILTALTMEKPIAGLLALSTYIPLLSQVPELATASESRIPILWCHGTEDKAVNCKDWAKPDVLAEKISIPFVLSTDSEVFVNTKEDEGPVLQFRKIVGMGHWVEPGELGDVATWLKRCVPTQLE